MCLSLCWLVTKTNGMIYGKEYYWTGIWRFRWYTCMFSLSWDWCPWNTPGVSKTKEDSGIEATFVTAIEQQAFPECWCGHRVVHMVGQMGEKRLEYLTLSCTPMAQNFPVTLKSGNFSEQGSLPGRGTQPSYCHAAHWVFRAQVDIWANTSWSCNAVMQGARGKEVF